jgi:hypothetical protein
MTRLLVKRRPATRNVIECGLPSMVKRKYASMEAFLRERQAA